MSESTLMWIAVVLVYTSGFSAMAYLGVHGHWGVALLIGLILGTIRFQSD